MLKILVANTLAYFSRPGAFHEVEHKKQGLGLTTIIRLGRKFLPVENALAYLPRPGAYHAVECKNTCT